MAEGDASPGELTALAGQSYLQPAVYDVLTNGTVVVIDLSTP